MSNDDLKTLHTVLLDAFTAEDVQELLAFDMDIDLDAVTARGPWRTRAFELVQYARRNGRLAELVAAVAKARSKRPDAQALAAKYAGKPAVELQVGGAVQSDVPVRDDAFEKTLRADLGFIDAAVWSATFGLMQRRVCRVEMNDPTDDMGTGFLVGPDVLLTAKHVFDAVYFQNNPASRVSFRFDYRTTAGGGTADGTVVRLAGASDPSRPWQLAMSEKAVDGSSLDYVLVRLDRSIGNEPAPGTTAPRGWVDLPTADPKLDGQPLLMILQHPARQPLKLAFDTNPMVVVTLGGQRVQYQVNTERGSSGSPVFDRDWNLLAVHHYGVESSFNQGVPIWSIRQSLPPAALATVGPPTDKLLQFEAVSAGVAAVSAELKGGKAPDHDRLAAVALAATEGVYAEATDVILKIDKDVEDEFDGKIDELKGKLKEGIRTKPVDELKGVTDEFRADVCSLLRLIERLNGGKLPKKYHRLWADNGCN